MVFLAMYYDLLFSERNKLYLQILPYFLQQQELMNCKLGCGQIGGTFFIPKYKRSFTDQTIYNKAWIVNFNQSRQNLQESKIDLEDLFVYLDGHGLPGLSL